MTGEDAPLVYVDFDDVLCQTARTFIDIVAREFGRRYAFEDIHSFNLETSFELTPEEYEYLMTLVHNPAILRIMAPMPGALDVLNDWHRRGIRTLVVTGRPPATEPVCHEWLERYRVPYEQVIFVDKYARAHPPHNDVQVLSPEELAHIELVLAVEDAPAMIRFLVEQTDIPVALLDRPWNRDLGFTHEAIDTQVTRCPDWAAVADLVSARVRCFA